MKELGFDSKYTPAAMQALGQYCREWRDQSEEKSGRTLDWSVKIYSNEGMDGTYTPKRMQRQPPPGLLFMPLARPPCVVANEQFGITSYPDVCRDEPLEEWGSAV
jgi:hypothetical protein